MKPDFFTGVKTTTKQT